MKKIALLLLLVGSVFVFDSCTKRGNTGPEGPQGPQGNANVIGSDAFTVGSSPSNQWSSSGSTWYATFTDNDITQDIVDHGVLEVFKLYPNIGWTNLPDIDGNISTVFNFVQGSFTISVLTTDGSATPNPGSVTFRTVVIAPSQKQAHPNTNWKNYNEVMKVLAEDNAAAATNTTKVSQ